MIRVRFHGRGGQGIKTASRVLGRAFFEAGYEVQDAPRYGAERRGAPIFAYVRAQRGPIFERGVIQEPDLVVVVDDTLLSLAAAGVFSGVDVETGLLFATRRNVDLWRRRLNLEGPVYTTPPAGDPKRTSLIAAGAAARWVGKIGRNTLRRAVDEELAHLDPGLREAGEDATLFGYDEFAGRSLALRNRRQLQLRPPRWVDLDAAYGRASVPAIFGEGTCTALRTGLWRTTRPVIDADRCHRCWWVCSMFCPDNAIKVDSTVVAADQPPTIDLDHCKGCAICAVQCPHHAIDLVAEGIKEEVPS